MHAIAKAVVVCVFVLVCALSVSKQISADDNLPSKPPKPYVTLSGARSKIDQPGYHLVTSAKQWTELWCQHVGETINKEFGYDDLRNPAGVPEVDFDQCMIVAIFEGKQINIARLQAASLIESEKQITLRYEDKGYQTGGGPDSAGAKGNEATPYGFFIVRRSSKPLAIEANAQNYKGQPPVWKEAHRFPAR